MEPHVGGVNPDEDGVEERRAASRRLDSEHGKLSARQRRLVRERNDGVWPVMTLLGLMIKGYKWYRRTI